MAWRIFKKLKTMSRVSLSNRQCKKSKC